MTLCATAQVKKAEALYVHLPFCRKKCGYCHFFSEPVAGQQLADLAAKYFVCVQRELADYRAVAGPFTTVYFGGGTPSLIPAVEYHKFIGQLSERYGLAGSQLGPAEVSCEVNPEAITADYLFELADAGINRLSVGCQSFDDQELKRLGRNHSGRQAQQAIELARQAGIENINCDLLGGIPGSSSDNLKRSIGQAVEMGVQHLSVYFLDSQLDSDFLAGRGWTELEELRGLRLTRQTLNDAGYANYELANYAQPGAACRHNLAYWQGRNYIGLGPSACSLLAGKRYENRANLDEYLSKGAERKEELLDRQTMLREKIMLGLRLREGISGAELAELAGHGWGALRQRIGKLSRAGLISFASGRIALTPQGAPLADRVTVELF
jgi:oxygen-independent coproporphyrinogen-3 oxidase